MNSNLIESIDKLYLVFSTYPGNQSMNASPIYGNIAKWNADLFSKPLKELTADDLSLFTGKVLTTWGELDDFKHFLPRILELTALMDPPNEVGVVYHKLDYGDWLRWSEEERKAIEEFNILLWSNILNGLCERIVWQFSEYLYALLASHSSPEELLSLWDKSESNAADIHLSRFIFNEHHKLFEKIIDPNYHELIMLKDWLLDKRNVERLQNAFFSCKDKSLAEEISWSEKILENAIR